MCQIRSAHEVFLEDVEIISHSHHAKRVYSLVLKAPKIAASIKPGQFIHLDIGDADLTLRRPFSVFAISGSSIEILYQVIGRGTSLLAKKTPGSPRLSAIGPLGHGWPIRQDAREVLLVAGGLGAAPLGMLVGALHDTGAHVTLAQGAMTEEGLVAREYFDMSGCECRRATDDGTCGDKGYVTVPVQDLLRENSYDVAYVCGPEVMQESIVKLLTEHNIETYVSLERLMACGVGACLSCVVETRHGKRRACVDGPVFNAIDLDWEKTRASRIG